MATRVRLEMGTKRVERPNYGSSDLGIIPMALKLGPEPLYSTRSPRKAVLSQKPELDFGQPSPRSSEPTIYRPNKSLLHPHVEETHLGVILHVG